MFMPTKFIALDNEGVIYDGEPIYVEAVNMVLRKRGLQKVTLEEHKNYIGKTKKEYWLAISNTRNFSEPIDYLIKEKDKYHTEILETKPIKVLPGIICFLEEAKKRGYIIVVATSADPSHLTIILRKTGLKKYIYSTASSEECKHGKPYPDVYLLAAERAGMKPSQGVSVEDSMNGMLSAKRAGYKTIAVPTDFTRQQDFSSADLVLSSIGEFDFNKFKTFLEK